MKKVLVLILSLLLFSCSNQVDTEAKDQFNANISNKSMKSILHKDFNGNIFSTKPNYEIRLELPSSEHHGGDKNNNSFKLGIKPGLYGPKDVPALEKTTYSLIVTEQQIEDLYISSYRYAVYLSEWDVEKDESIELVDHLCYLTSNSINVKFPSSSQGKIYKLTYMLYETIYSPGNGNPCEPYFNHFISYSKLITVE